MPAAITRMYTLDNENKIKIECGPMTNVMATLSNIHCLKKRPTFDLL